MNLLTNTTTFLLSFRYQHDCRRCLLGSGPPDVPPGLPTTKGSPKSVKLLSPVGALTSPKSARSPKHSPHPTLTSPPTLGGGGGFLSPGGQTQYTFGTAGVEPGQGQGYHLGLTDEQYARLMKDKTGEGLFDVVYWYHALHTTDGFTSGPIDLQYTTIKRYPKPPPLIQKRIRSASPVRKNSTL